MSVRLHERGSSRVANALATPLLAAEISLSGRGVEQR